MDVVFWVVSCCVNRTESDKEAWPRLSLVMLQTCLQRFSVTVLWLTRHEAIQSEFILTDSSSECKHKLFFLTINCEQMCSDKMKNWFWNRFCRCLTSAHHCPVHLHLDRCVMLKQQIINESSTFFLCSTFILRAMWDHAQPWAAAAAERLWMKCEVQSGVKLWTSQLRVLTRAPQTDIYHMCERRHGVPVMLMRVTGGQAAADTRVQELPETKKETLVDEK